MSKISEKEKWEDNLPKIVVCGLRRSGKSSVLRVLFNKLSPHEASYIEPTTGPTFLPMSTNPLLNMRIAEIPGNWQWDESAEMDEIFFAKCQSLIFVIDSSSEDVPSAVYSLSKRVIARALAVNSEIHVHLFLHKIDANYKFDPDSVQAESNKALFMQTIVSKISQDVKRRIDLSAHCTSIFDTSIHEAFSKVVQRPLLASGKVEQIMDAIVTTCRLEKAVLFDIVSKLNFATDSTGHSSSTYSLLQDMLEVVVDMGSIYNNNHLTSENTECSISLSNGEILFMRLIEKSLAFVAIIKAENFDKTFLLNHNLNAFKDALMLITK